MRRAEIGWTYQIVGLAAMHKQLVNFTTDVLQNSLCDFLGSKWKPDGIGEFQPFSRHFALNGAGIWIKCRGPQIQTMRGVMRVIFVPVVVRIGHDPRRRESPNDESGRIAMTSLSNIEPFIEPKWKMFVGSRCKRTAALENALQGRSFSGIQ
jgi:hypothetical protein